MMWNVIVLRLEDPWQECSDTQLSWAWPKDPCLLSKGLYWLMLTQVFDWYQRKLDDCSLSRYSFKRQKNKFLHTAMCKWLWPIPLSRFAVADAQDLSAYGSGSFDVVSCIAALFMIPDPSKWVTTLLKDYRSPSSITVQRSQREQHSFQIGDISVQYCWLQKSACIHEAYQRSQHTYTGQESVLEFWLTKVTLVCRSHVMSCHVMSTNENAPHWCSYV